MPLDGLRNRDPDAKWRVHSASIVTTACDGDSESLILGADFVSLDDLRNRDPDAKWRDRSASIVCEALRSPLFLLAVALRVVGDGNPDIDGVDGWLCGGI